MTIGPSGERRTGKGPAVRSLPARSVRVLPFLARSLGALCGRTARLRWLHLLLGGALLMPYWLLASVLLAPVTTDVTPLSGSLRSQFQVYAFTVPIAAVSACAPVARPLSVAAARALCGVPAGALVDGPARTWGARLRTAAWFALHSGLGALVSGASLAIPPAAGTMIVVPFLPSLRRALRVPDFPDWVFVVLPLGGTAMLLALAGCAAAAGRLLSWSAPRLLGPSPADRLAAAEERAARLAERNRIARELHDSVGHALSAVTLQAGAALRVLERNPPFVQEALTAIEETARRTVGELDAVLGLLREDGMNGADGVDRASVVDGTGGAGPGLESLAGLVSRSGLTVAVTGDDDFSAVPRRVSREAYRIVQEGLTNALRHGGGAPVALWIGRRDG
ncbi:two-component system sensor kinase, partial [Streptomyces clavuligerus]